MSRTLRMLSLCSGIGGIDLAACWTGAIEIAGQVEIDGFCRAVLAKHWPDVPRMNDVREVKGHEFGHIDIVAAGFPCQPHSLAGKRQAAEDERDLWPEIKRLLGTIRPRWFVGENVYGLLTSDTGRFFGTILADLVTLGYRVGWAVYGACDVGAPHKRERIFLVAYSRRTRQRERTYQSQCERECNGTPNPGNDGTQGIMADSQSIGRRSRWAERESAWQTLFDGTSDDVADAKGAKRSCTGDTRTGRIGLTNGCSVVEYSHNQRCQEQHTPTVASESRFACGSNPGPVESSTGPGWEERAHTERAYHQFDASSRLVPQSAICGSSHGPTDWMDRHQWPALPRCQPYTWEPPRTVTGRQPYRNQRIKALGNAVVPQHIYPVFQAIVEVENESEVSA